MPVEGETPSSRKVGPARWPEPKTKEEAKANDAGPGADLPLVGSPPTVMVWGVCELVIGRWCGGGRCRGFRRFAGGTSGRNS